MRSGGYLPESKTHTARGAAAVITSGPNLVIACLIARLIIITFTRLSTCLSMQIRGVFTTDTCLGCNMRRSHVS